MSVESAERYLNVVETAHRERLGQFFTPPFVARFMCQWALEESPPKLFDPAFGLGSFFFAAEKIAPDSIFEGIERDKKVLDHFFSDHSITNLESLRLKQGDYFSAWGASYPAIVCNPPYMRFQNFLDRDKVIPEIEKRTGLKLSGYTNLASAFLLKSLHELGDGGKLAYLMPLEFLNTGYGEVVKRALLEGGGIKALIRIEPEEEVFPDATTSVGIVLVHKDSVKHAVRFCTVTSMSQLEQGWAAVPGRSVNVEELDPVEKWLRHFDEPQKLNHSELVPVSSYGAFSRGIATGANEFFIVSRQEAAELGLPASTLRACIARSSQVRQGYFTESDLRRLADNDERVFLVDLASSGDESVKKYIAKGRSLGFDQRFLTRTRKPWFKLEARKPSPILFGVFSRDGFKVIRNTSSAVSLTCFHCFYPNLFGHDFVDYLFLYFNSPASQKILSQEARKYGGKLDKFEPRDLNRALAPSPQWFSRIPEALAKKQLDRIARGEGLDEAACRLFDTLI